MQRNAKLLDSSFDEKSDAMGRPHGMDDSRKIGKEADTQNHQGHGRR